MHFANPHEVKGPFGLWRCKLKPIDATSNGQEAETEKTGAKAVRQIKICLSDGRSRANKCCRKNGKSARIPSSTK